MMDNPFDVQYLLERNDYGAVSVLYNLWKKRKLTTRRKRLKGVMKCSENLDDSLWDESLNLGSKVPDKSPTGICVEQSPGEDLYGGTGSSVDGSNQYNHLIPNVIESDTDDSSDEGREYIESYGGNQIKMQDTESESVFGINKSGPNGDSNSMSSNPTDDHMSSRGHPDSPFIQTSTSYDHVVPGEDDQQEGLKETVELQHDKENKPKHKEHYDELEQVETSKTLVIPTPSDGSCFYHAISRYLQVNERTNEIKIVDLQSIVKKNVKDYETKHQLFSHSEGKISKYLRHTINSFIYANVDLLLKLFHIKDLLDGDFNFDMKTAREMLQTNALQSVSQNTKWAGTAQIFVFSLMTLTPLCVWVKGVDHNYYVRGTQTAFQLAHIEKLFKEDFRLKSEFDAVTETVKIKNEKNTVINLLLGGCHYETIVLLE